MESLGTLHPLESSCHHVAFTCQRLPESARLSVARALHKLHFDWSFVSCYLSELVVNSAGCVCFLESALTLCSVASAVCTIPLIALYYNTHAFDPVAVIHKVGRWVSFRACLIRQIGLSVLVNDCSVAGMGSKLLTKSMDIGPLSQTLCFAMPCCLRGSLPASGSTQSSTILSCLKSQEQAELSPPCVTLEVQGWSHLGLTAGILVGFNCWGVSDSFRRVEVLPLGKCSVSSAGRGQRGQRDQGWKQRG